MLRGVKFGNYHTAREWEMILNAMSIDPPKVKTSYISVEGRDGSLDLTEALTGEIKFENRKASFTFLLMEGTYLERESIIVRIYALIHGHKLQIITDDDPEHYLIGRCEIVGKVNNHSYGSITIEAECDPYRYALYDTVRTIEVTGTPKDILLSNKGIKSVTPTLTVTGSVKITVGNTSIALSAGEYKITDLIVRPGETLIQVEGVGTLVVTYKEGIL